MPTFIYLMISLFLFVWALGIVFPTAEQKAQERRCDRWNSRRHHRNYHQLLRKRSPEIRAQLDEIYGKAVSIR